MAALEPLLTAAGDIEGAVILAELGTFGTAVVATMLCGEKVSQAAAKVIDRHRKEKEN